MSTEEVKPMTIKKLPLILNRNIILKKPLNSNIKLVKSLQSSVKEDIIYTSKLGDFTSGEVRKMTIVNSHNIKTNCSKTVAKCQSHSGHIFEKTSDEITKLIGQDNYDILFGSLCSIINQELKIRSINAILTVQKKNKSVACQTDAYDMSSSVLRNVVDSSCQTTEETWSGQHKSEGGLKRNPVQRKRNKRQQLAPYVVRDEPNVKQPRRIVISPNKFDSLFVKEETVFQKESPTTESSLPELGSVFDEDSNNSIGQFSVLSITTTPDLLDNPLNILTNVDKHTRDISNDVKPSKIETMDRFQSFNSPCGVSHVNEKVPFVMQETLQNTSPEQRIKLLLHQGLTALSNCLTRNSDGHLPIHVAVLTNDVHLLRRQCLVLKMKGSNVDVPADGLTPLRMSLFQQNTQITADLLHFGADPLDTDDDDRTAFHVAAELSTDHLQILINHCQQNARKILHENEHLWCSAYDYKPDEELAPILLTYINKLYDSQGYTPLMLASKLGKYNNVMALVESSRATINLTMPNSGNTALYLAVGAACMDAAERGNKAKIVDHFSKTVEILVENGADPAIDNFSGSSVNDLLTEFNIPELSMLIANKLTSIRYFDGQLPNGIKGSDFMLFKDNQGKVNLKEMKEDKRKKSLPKEPLKPPPSSTNTKPTTTKSAPIIIENIEYKPPIKVDNPTENLKAVPCNYKTQPEVGTSNVGKSPSKQANKPKLCLPLVKNFKLNKPLIIKSEVANNKRKLDIVVDSTKTKKPNKND